MRSSRGIRYFEEQVPEGWIYPCSLEDIEVKLSQMPEDDTQGIWSIGLVPSTAKNNDANARYFWSEKPKIAIYSHHASLTFRLPSNVSIGQAQQFMKVELEYGIRIEKERNRLVCRWDKDNLREFIINHVLAHEIGHHVYHLQRYRNGLEYKPRTNSSEQFAESYALKARNRA